MGDILPGGMLHRDGPFRFVLTILVALAIPFCCCDVRSLIGECGSSRAAGPAGVHIARPDGETGRGASADPPCHGGCSQGDDVDQGTPSDPPGKDQHDCPCPKTTGKMLASVASTFEPPAPGVVAILDWFGLPALRQPEILNGEHGVYRAVEPPSTSLLRLHCALLV